MRSPLAVCLLVLSLSGPVSAQTGPTAAAPPSAQVLGLSNIIHATSHLETTIAFYRDVFGLDAQPRPLPIPAVALLNNVPGITLRLAVLKLPDAGFGFELTEFSNFDPQPAQALHTDPGAATLILRVRDMDAVLAAIKKCGAPIISRSGTPVKIHTGSGTLRSLLVRDPDGYVVQAVEVLPSNAMVPGTVQPGVAMGLTVADMATTRRFYRDLLGFELTGSMNFAGDNAILALAGAPKGSKFRQMSAMVPGSTGRIDFYEFQGMHRTPFHLRPPDPGAPAMTLRVANLEELLKILKANGVKLESANGEAVQLRPTSRNIFVEDPNGLNIELVESVRPPQ